MKLFAMMQNRLIQSNFTYIPSNFLMAHVFALLSRLAHSPRYEIQLIRIPLTRAFASTRMRYDRIAIMLYKII